MSANVETAVYANTPAWHGEGIVLDSEGKKGLTIEKALPASGLDWTVEKVPIYGSAHYTKQEDGTLSPDLSNLKLIQGRFGVQRNTDGEILGVVGKTWQPVQNTEGFQIINDVIEQAGGDKVYIEAAGALNGGRKVWVLAHVDQGLRIAGEDYMSYIVFLNGHDGRTSVTALMTDVRVVCQNTLAMAVSQQDKKTVAAERKEGVSGGGRIVRVRHTTKAGERIKEAHTILGMRNRRAEELAVQGEWLVEQSMDDGEFMSFLDKLMPIEDPDTPAATMITDRRASIARLFMDAPNLKPIRNTRWGALNAVVEYADYGRSFASSETQLKAQWGLTPATIKDQAYQLLVK